MKKPANNDIIGRAILDYQLGRFTENIITYSSIAGNDEMDIPFLFRSHDEMPIIEQNAMELCYGHVLDVGCGAGSHALYLQNKNCKVTAIDTSQGAIKTCKLRGVKTAINKDIWEVKNSKFDTILALMNGVGICKNLEYLDSFLLHLKSLLRPQGQILLDSSDVIYMYDEKHRESIQNDKKKYYGNVIFEMVYLGQFSPLIYWLFIDFDRLRSHAEKNGLKCELIKSGFHNDYLARLQLNSSQ